MALSINWLTRVITVPKADLAVVQSNPFEIRQLDIDAFRLELHDIQDGDGMAYPDIFRHIAPVTVGGVTLARVVEIINGYTITFENGTYAVNITGGNSNISDRANLNSVQVRAANSAGLVQIISGSGLSVEQDQTLATLLSKVLEMWAIEGLDVVNPMTVTPTSRVAGAIAQAISGDGTTTSTVTRLS